MGCVARRQRGPNRIANRRVAVAARGRSAFTMIELLVAMSVLALLTIGLASAIVISSHALPDRRSDSRAVLATSAALDQMGGDIALARELIVMDKKSVEFTVADRDGDGSAEQLCYSWSGTVGDPLLFTRNGSKSFPVVENLQDFGLKFETRSASEDVTSTAHISSGETLLASFTGWTGLTPTSTTFSVSSSRYILQAFGVAWPSGATDCQITRVRCRMKQGATASSTFSVGLYTEPASGLGVGGSLGNAVSMTSGALPVAFGWQDFIFSDAVTSASATRFVFQIKGGSSSNTANVEYYNNALARDDGTYCAWSTNSGGAWSPTILTINQNDMPIYVYGAYTTHAAQTTTLARTLVYAVSISLRTVEQKDPIEVRIGLLNTPEATP